MVEHLEPGRLHGFKRCQYILIGGLILLSQLSQANLIRAQGINDLSQTQSIFENAAGHKNGAWVRELKIRPIAQRQDLTPENQVNAISIKRPLSLFDLYLDEERPFIQGEASKALVESVELLDSHRGAKLSVETYCDQRNTSAYGMVLSNRRTWQLKEFVQYLEIPNSRVSVVSYGNEDLQCREKSTVCWEEKIRVQAAFKYLAISQPKFGCLVRLGLMGVDKEFLPISTSRESQFLQKIRLAPAQKRRRSIGYVDSSPLNFPSS